MDKGKTPTDDENFTVYSNNKMLDKEKEIWRQEYSESLVSKFYYIATKIQSAMWYQDE
jgi:hypothetical protein